MENATTKTCCDVCDSPIPDAHITGCPVLDGAKPLADEIPMRKAWRVKRRVYVVCGYRSRLNDQLRGIGAKWDREAEALWVGSGKADTVAEMVRQNLDAQAQAAQRKADGHPVKIPYQATGIRQQAKEMGALWDRDSKSWVLPTEDAAATIRGLVEASRKTKASGPKVASPQQVDLIMALIAQGAWHDSDAGQGFHPPTRGEVEQMSARDASALISDLKGDLY